MMHPPALSGENAGIQKAFEKAVNDKNIVMKTPTTGDYRSSFILYDFDGDGEDEAIALYSYSTDETAVYLHSSTVATESGSRLPISKAPAVRSIK